MSALIRGGDVGVFVHPRLASRRFHVPQRAAAAPLTKKAGFRRVEVLTGPGRRRRWSAAEKARIIAETLVPGARVSAVARRWQICPQQVFGWRRQARVDVAEQPPDPSRCLSSAFVPIVTEAVTAARPAGSASPPAVIEIKLAGAVVRVVSGTDTALLSAVLRAVRSSAAPA